MSETLPTALAFARHGHPVLPLHWIVEKDGLRACSCGATNCSPGKHPLSRLGMRTLALDGVRSATTDTGVIKHWWSMAPEANLGVAARNLLILDVDARDDGLQSLGKLEAEHGDMPATWTVITGSGGLHFYFKRPDGLPPATLIAKNIIREGGTPPFGEGIDVPGYVVAPPSAHVSGGRYQWEASGHPSDIALVEPPAWVLERLTSFQSRAAAVAATAPADWAKMTGGLITEYQDVHATRVAGKLLRAISLDPRFAAGLLHAWNRTFCDPPLSDHELKQIFDRIANREADRLERLNERSAAE